MKGDSDKILTAMHSKLERDLQGESGGGLGAAYDNPGLAVSTTSISNDNVLRGSNAFILVDDENEKKPTCDISEVGSWMKKKAKSAFRKKMIHKRLPFLSWLPNYNLDYAIGDLVAGITVGLTVIPQSLAYSNIAGLPPEYGLYGSFLGCFVYILLGSCKDVPMGPTAIASLLTFQTVKGMGPEHAILLCFLSGLIEVLMGFFGLGFLIDFVSGPVASGFTSAVALIIVSSQVKDIFGITTKGSTFLETCISIFENIKHTNAADAILGGICIIVLLLMRIVATIKIGPPEISNADKKLKDEDKGPSRIHKIINKTLWLIGTSRNAILVVLCGYIGYLFYVDKDPPFKLIGDIPPGLPDFKPPAFSMERDNKTITFLDMVSNLGSGIIVVPLIALLENIAICKAFSNGKAVDATQELLAIGMANIANSFVQGFPGTGSLSRSAVNNSSGVRTPMGGLYTGLLVIISLVFFTPLFFYIPKASLAAIIIAAVIFMVEVKVVKPMWRSKKTDLLPFTITFVACLVMALELGILVGIAINLMFILYHAARPKISIEKLVSRSGVEYLMVTPDRCLIFPSVDYVRNLVTKQSIRAGIPVVIDCSHIYGADYTAATVIETLTKDFALRKQPLFFFNLKSSVCATFEGVGPKDFNMYYNLEDIDRLLKEKDAQKQNEPLEV